MKVLIHTMEAAESLVKMKKAIETALPNIKGETFSTLESLAQRLKEPYDGEEKVALLAATDQKNLEDFLSLQRLFLNVPLILLVPNRSTETMALAHRLRPRFLNDVQGDFTAVIEVLRKMVAVQGERGAADSPPKSRLGLL
ncbi:MAG TPA: hypothetical protein VEL68_19950 [Thermodesulfobacteriota bacterium]|nr:hypothetical protein [Thermodesulfobacteriota bacterium]